MKNLNELTKKIKLLVLDFDGVLTDNRVIVDEDGKESVICDRGDGLGLDALRKRIPIVVISKETNKVVKARCKKLKIRCYNSIDDKLTQLKKVCGEYKIGLGNVCYVGNDINDLDCVKAVGFGVAVADSHPKVLSSAKYVTKKNGGRGAVREVCGILLSSLRRS